MHVIACRSEHPTTTNEEKTSVKKIYYKHIINKQKYTNKVEECILSKINGTNVSYAFSKTFS